MTRILLALCCLYSPLVAADFTTYVGDMYQNRTTAIATDAAGNTYLTGTRLIPPGSSSISSTTDIFISKLDASGTIVFTTTFSGKSNDTASAIAVDGTGNIFVAGSTTSTNFPLLGALQTTPGQGTTGFLMKLAPNGSLLFSTYFGGTQGSSELSGVAVDQSGDVYVTGTTSARDYPRTAGMPAGIVSFPGPSSISGALIAKISASGDKVLYAGVVSGTAHLCGGGSSCFLSGVGTGGNAIAVDGSGNAYVAGNSGAPDLPVTPGALSAGAGAFVMKIKADGSGLAYLTYLSSTIYGSSGTRQPSTTVRALAADASGNVFLTGDTADPKFPVTAEAFQTTYSIPVNDNVLFGAPPASDAFVAKLKPDGTAMVWATYLGVAENGESGTTLTVDSGGTVYVAGTSVTRETLVRREFVAKIDPLGTTAQMRLQPLNTAASGIALAPQGGVLQAGETGIVANADDIFSGTRLFGPTNAAKGELTGRLAPGEIISIYGEALGPESATTAAPNAGAFPTMLGETQVTIGGVAAPLLYVSPTQINTVVPNGTLPGTSVSIRILVGGELRGEFRAVIAASDPQLFRSSTGSAAAVNQDGTINSASNPAAWGSYVSVWATGTGPFPGLDGRVATEAQSYCYCSVSAGLPVVYSGSSPGLINGAVQVNFLLPAGSVTIAVPITLSAGGNSSESVPIFVKP